MVYLLNFTHILQITLEIKLISSNTITLMSKVLESFKFYDIVSHMTLLTMYIILLDKLFLLNTNILVVREIQLNPSNLAFLFGPHLLHAYFCGEEKLCWSCWGCLWSCRVLLWVFLVCAETSTSERVNCLCHSWNILLTS